MLPLFTLLLLSLSCALAAAGTLTMSPQMQHTQQTAARTSPHLTYALNARHHTPSPSTTAFHPLSLPASPHHSSRFTTLQHSLATANMSGCASIDFTASVMLAGQGPFLLIVDTGSTTLAVVSSACTNCDGATPTYTPAAGSETYSNQPVGSTYGGGTSWTGHAYKAAVAVGDSDAVTMAIANIELNNKFIDGSKVCNVETGALIGLNTSQGIIGFAYPSIAIPGTDSWITKYVAATGVSNEFTLQMCPVGGNLWIGSYDAAFLASPFTYIPIIEPNFYAVMLNDISVLTQDNNGNTVKTQSLGYTSAQYGPCENAANTDCTIVDSGTTLLQLPNAIYTSLLTLLQTDSYYSSTFSGANDPLGSSHMCVAANSVPPLAELQQRLPKLSLTFLDAANNNPTTLTLDSIPGYLNINYGGVGNDTQTFYCSGVSGSNGYALLGYAFMNQFTVRHDLQGQRLGFARTAQCGVAAPPLPNYAWTTGAWGACSVASCGGGVQWRSVDCTDIFGTKHPDIACATTYTAARPADSQACNTTACASVTPAQFTAVAANVTAVQQGQTITITYTYSTGSPDYVTLIVTPAASSAAAQASYIARNATAGGGPGTYTYDWYVPSTLAPGAYHLGAYTAVSGSGGSGSSVYTGGATLTVAACTAGACAAGRDVCAAYTCSGQGECDTVSDAAVCTCTSAYNGTDCGSLTACTTQCINGGTLDTGSCQCGCPAGYTGPLCERRYANLTATLSLAAASTTSPGNAAAFQQAFTTDIAYALGLRPAAVVVQSVGAAADGQSTLVVFQLASMGASDTLQAAVDALTTQLASLHAPASTLTAGLTTAALTAVSEVSGPPTGAVGGASPSVGRQYWPYILGGAGGFALIFAVLYCLNGGRCVGCRRRKLDASVGGLAAPQGGKGSGSVARQVQVGVGKDGGAAKKHAHRPSHQSHQPHHPRSSYFAQAKPAAAV